MESFYESSLHPNVHSLASYSIFYPFTNAPQVLRSMLTPLPEASVLQRGGEVKVCVLF